MGLLIDRMEITKGIFDIVPSESLMKTSAQIGDIFDLAQLLARSAKKTALRLQQNNPKPQLRQECKEVIQQADAIEKVVHLPLKNRCIPKSPKERTVEKVFLKNNLNLQVSTLFFEFMLIECEDLSEKVQALQSRHERKLEQMLGQSPQIKRRRNR